jgi:predicted oxidoreductase
MWRLGDSADISPGHIREKIEACLEQGITTMDHADIYGGYGVEELFGAALRGTDLAGRVEIVTKCGILMPAGRYAETRIKHYDTSAGHVRASIEHSLRLLGIERIDLLLIHRPDPLMDHGETGRALDDAVASGKVRAVGVSNFRPWDFELLQSAMSTPLVTNQIELSLVRHDAFTEGDLAFLQRKRLRPMAWSPLAGGALIRGESHGALRAALSRIASEAGTDVGAVAVAWLLAHPAGILPVMGTNDLSRVRKLSDACRVEIDRQTWFELYERAIGREVP